MTLNFVKIIISSLFLSLSLFMGCQKPKDEVAYFSEEFEVIYPEVNEKSVNGTSNAVGFGPNWFVMTTSNPINNLLGYPDPNALFYKLGIGGSLPTTFLETSACMADPNHCYVSLKPGGNIGVVYQRATGDMYGFDLMYKEFSSSGSLQCTEKVFSNQNCGAWPRLEFSSSGTAYVAAFAHEDYTLNYYQKKVGKNSWQHHQLTEPGTPMGEVQSAIAGESFCVSARFGSGSQQSLRYFQILGDSHTSQDIEEGIGNNCDLFIDGFGTKRFLYTLQNKLKLRFLNSFQYEIVTSEYGIDHRAKISIDNNNNLVVTYQTPTKVVVMRKQNSQWMSIWEQTFAIPLTYAQLGQGPSFINIANGLYVIFSNGEEIEKHQIQ